MGKKLFIGNLDWNVKEEQLREVFEKYGALEDLVIIKDNLGRSKGFAFATFSNEEDAQKAMSELNNTKLGNRDIVVNEAKPKKEFNR